MLTSCPECGKQVSDKAQSCPNCGYSVSFPSFYIQSSNIGLDLTWLLMDYIEEIGGGDSCFGWSPSDIRALLDNYNEEMREATRREASAIIQKVQSRLTQISENCEEHKQLLLLLWYVARVSMLANGKSLRNLELTCEQFEGHMSKVTLEDDRHRFETALSDLRSEIATLKAKAQQPRSVATGLEETTARPKSSSFGSWGCAILVVTLAAALIAIFKDSGSTRPSTKTLAHNINVAIADAQGECDEMARAVKRDGSPKSLTLDRASNTSSLTIEAGEAVELVARGAYLLAAKQPSARVLVHWKEKGRSRNKCFAAGPGVDDTIARPTDRFLIRNEGGKRIEELRVCAAFNAQQVEQSCEPYIGLNLDFYHSDHFR